MSEHYMLQFFDFRQLPEHLQQASYPFCNLAHVIVDCIQDNPERTTALRKLLEARDCALRAVQFKTVDTQG